jgi:hypothetical protein
VPEDFKVGMIVPFIKDKRKVMDDVNNYTFVIIICVISQLFKTCILNKYGNNLKVNGMQLGFVKRYDKCLYSVTNVILDTAAAFDKV